MRRYPHWLQPLSRVTYPQRIICVDCTGTLSYTDGRETIQTEALSSWHSVCLARDGSTYRAVRQVSGSESVSWWHGLRDYLHHKGQTWILSCRCTRVWSLLKLWEGLEDGTVTIAGWDARTDSERAATVLTVRTGQRDALGPVSAGAVSRMLDAHDGLLVTEDPPCILAAQVSGEKGEVMWVDTRNYGYDVPDTITPGMPTAIHLSEWIDSLVRLLAQYRLGSLCTTVAAQAMTAFRTSYYTGGIYVSTEPRATSVEVASYCGGRCECSVLGDVAPNLWHIDRRSAYGWHCAHGAVPGRVQGSIRNNVVPSAVAGADCGRSIATAHIETDEPDYPVRRDGLVIWPVGRYVTTLCGPELCDALERGRIAHIDTMVTYHMDYYLRDYAHAVYRARVESGGEHDSAHAAMCKRLLVSLPGKLGQRQRLWVRCDDHGIGAQYASWIGSDGRGGTARYRTIAGHTQRDEDAGLAPDAVPAIASWITSAARVELLRAIRIAGREHVYYYDTDSLMVDDDGMARLSAHGLIQPGILGGWSVREGPAHVELLGIKHYVFDGQTTCAGQPRGTMVSAGDGQHYWYTASPSQQLRRNRQPEATSVLRSYARRSEYRHGVVRGDGRVEPIVLQEW